MAGAAVQRPAVGQARAASRVRLSAGARTNPTGGSDRIVSLTHKEEYDAASSSRASQSIFSVTPCTAAGTCAYEPKSLDCVNAVR